MRKAKAKRLALPWLAAPSCRIGLEDESRTPFAMSMGDNFRPPAPPALTGAVYAAAFDEVKPYSTNAAWTNADQSQVVWFWVDMPGTVTTAGRWNKIAQSVATNTTLAENARQAIGVRDA